MYSPVLFATAFQVIHCICLTMKEQTAESRTPFPRHHGLLAKNNYQQQTMGHVIFFFFSEPIHSNTSVIPRVKHFGLQATEDSRALFNSKFSLCFKEQNRNHFLVIIPHLGKTISNAQ